MCWGHAHRRRQKGVLPGAGTAAAGGDAGDLPLISLMKDQVMALKHAGVPRCLTSTPPSPRPRRPPSTAAWPPGPIKSSMWPRSGWRGSGLHLRRPGPGRLSGGGGRGPLCVPVGTGFSAQLPEDSAFLAQLPRRPAVGAFTATATQAVRQDIIQQLGLQSPAGGHRFRPPQPVFSRSGP